MKSLVIEDDQEIVEAVSLAIRMGWPDSETVATHLGKKGVELVETEGPDIVILDLGLPDISGFEVLKRIRLFSAVPIIILTVKAEEASIVKGLEWGADDYIVKPCGQLELMARIKARIRDSSNYGEESSVYYGPMYFDPTIRHFVNGKNEVKLTAIESHIVNCLMRKGGRVATYGRLADVVWGSEYPGSVDSLRVHIRRLREKIEDDPGNPKIVLTKSGIGYYMAKPE
jgi:two-component system KDP operon response regulator KdpE